MRSLFLLASVFVLLVGYLESTMITAPASVQLTTMTSVIRTPLRVQPPKTAAIDVNHATLPTQVNDVAPIRQSAKSSLNLKLPSENAVKWRDSTGLAANAQRRLMNLFKKEVREQVSYSAELIYDAEKGENITGGRVNIRIPLG